MGRKKRYIINNANVLNEYDKKRILNIVASEEEGALLGKPNKYSVDLDKIKSQDVINRIYNIVEHRKLVLSKPHN